MYGSNCSPVIYDWNERGSPTRLSPVELVDETLRDGCQSPTVEEPSLEHKLALLHLMEDLGIAWCNLGLPGRGRRAVDAIEVLLAEIGKNAMRIRGKVACRTLIEPDIREAADIVQRTGQELTVYAFIGSSPIRQWAEDWSLDFIVGKTREAIRFAVDHELKVVYVTEDTTRSDPAVLGVLFDVAVGEGAAGLCLCDTVGHATPHGLTELHRFTRDVLQNAGAPHVSLDWHGHNDRGLALYLALRAIEVGFDRVHACALGLGERCGNTSMDQLILNLKLLDAWPHDIRRLVEYVRLSSRATGVPIPCNYPLTGSDAFRTATGVHAAAIMKAEKKGDLSLAERVYSGVPPSEFGREQEIEVGQMSGISNVEHWLGRRGLSADRDLAQLILDAAKRSHRVLREEEILAVVDSAVARRSRPPPAEVPVAPLATELETVSRWSTVGSRSVPCSPSP